MADYAHKAALFEQLARVGKALANGKRLELIDLLAQGARSVDSLAQAAGLGLTTTSAHLQALKHAGLVATNREGTRIYYRLAGRDVADLYARLRDLATSHIADAALARAAYLGADADVDEITRDELLTRVKTGDATVLDVRPAVEYHAGHVPGALSIPLDELPDRLAEIPAGTEIVAYCRGALCVLAHDAVRLLRTKGHPARRMTDGMLEWRLAGLPVESGFA